MSSEEKAQAKQAFAVRLGERMRDLRKQAGLTQEQLADLAGYHPTYIGNIENATNLPTSHTIWRLARAMNIEPGETLRGL